jgi:hypothetical protein
MDDKLTTLIAKIKEQQTALERLVANSLERRGEHEGCVDFKDVSFIATDIEEAIAEYEAPPKPPEPPKTRWSHLPLEEQRFRQRQSNKQKRRNEKARQFATAAQG